MQAIRLLSQVRRPPQGIGSPASEKAFTMAMLTFTRCRGSSGGVKQKGAGCRTNGCGRRRVVTFLHVSPLRGHGG
jgi:hypothetical protein